MVVERGGAEDVYQADIVALAAGAANSAKFLLSSANHAHPNGLANGSDQVGRNYMYHNSKAVVVTQQRRPTTPPSKRRSAINDFYLAGDGQEFPLGNIQMVGKSNAGGHERRGAATHHACPPLVARRRRPPCRRFWLSTEDLPRPDNRVTVDGDGHIHLSYTATNNIREADDLYGELKKILNHAGMAQHHVLDKNFYMKMNIPVAGVAHQAGTCRFGSDPGESVLDRDLQSSRG